MRSDDFAILLADAEQRFWALVGVAGPEECWPWVGKTDRPMDRYPVFYVGMWADGRPVQRTVIRLAYWYARGADSLGAREHLDVTCGQEVCCNPAHLRRHKDVLAEPHDCVDHQTPAGRCSRCQAVYDARHQPLRVEPVGTRRCPRCETMRPLSTFHKRTVCYACQQVARRRARREQA